MGFLLIKMRSKRWSGPLGTLLAMPITSVNANKRLGREAAMPLPGKSPFGAEIGDG
jgi:hypothetical protein